MTWTVGDVMTRDVVTVDHSSSLQSCATKMRVHGVGALPVVDGARLEGIVAESDVTGSRHVPTVRDRYRALLHHHDVDGTMTAADVMTSRVVTTMAGSPIAAAAREMFMHRVDRLPVVDPGGQLVGIVSRSDLLRVFLRSDESIRTEVAENLAHDAPAIWHGWVVPHVRDGVVTLSGEVEQGTLVDVLLRLVAAVPGVVGVKNELGVVRRRPSPVEPGRPVTLARS